MWEGDLFAALPDDLRGRFAVIAVNAPYVPTERIADMPREARDFEPHVALDGGGDGLDVHRRVAAEAVRWLAPGGAVLIETGRTQAAWTALLLERAGLSAAVVSDDDIDGTVAIGRAPLRSDRGELRAQRLVRRLDQVGAVREDDHRDARAAADGERLAAAASSASDVDPAVVDALARRAAPSTGGSRCTSRRRRR